MSRNSKIRDVLMPAAPRDDIPDIEAEPGHPIRRWQRFAALAAAHRQAGMDPRTLAATIGFDTLL